jgi:anti-sigma factor RsiW
MNGDRCETFRDLLPERVLGLLPAAQEAEMEAHLASCPGCRREAEVVEALYQARPQPPEALAARIHARVREEMAVVEKGGLLPSWLPSWALPAAAVVVLALGTGILMEGRTPEVTGDPLQVAVQESAPEEWLWDDGMVAGAPVFEDLTEEELSALLEEFEG